MSDVKNWDNSAANNSDAAPDGFPEFMQPSDVNDSSREVMAAVKRMRDDLSGVGLATGASGDYVLTAASDSASYDDGDRYAFRANHTNAGAATLNINGIGQANIFSGNTLSALTGSEIQDGGAYDVIYHSGQFLLLNPNQTVTTLTPTQQIFTANGTWTKPAGVKYVEVELVGGGGAGGGANTTGIASGAVGSGGGGGGYARKHILAVALASTEPVTVGVGGAPVVAGTGGSGGQSLFGAHFSATGGAGGFSSGASNGFNLVSGAFGGEGLSGDVNVGGAGGGGGVLVGAQGLALGGSGGSSALGGGAGSAAGGLSPNNGFPGRSYGGAGSGAANGESDAQRAGGAGSAGIVIVREYY